MANTDGSIHIDTKVDSKGLLSGLDGLSAKAKGAISGITKIIAGAGAAIGAVGTYAVRVGTDFETAMSQVAATMGTTVDSIPELTAFAQEMGATTQFSATQAAEALNYLALAGYDAAKQMEALPTVLDIAAAGSMDLARASDLVTDAMAALGMETNDLTMFGNKLAKTASTTNTSVEQLGEALLDCAGFGKTTGQELDTMTTALGILANNGIKGSEAGHALQRVMKNLYTPTKNSAEALNELGVSAYNADGSARQMNDVLADLKVSLAGMTEEQKAAYMQQIFDVASLQGASALLKDIDNQWDGIYDGIAACTNETTEAKDMAKTMLDNLRGDLTLLSSAAEGFGIALFNQVNGPMRELTQLGAELLSDMTTAIQSDGLDGLGSAIGNALSKATAKIASYAPALISSAVDLVKSLVEGISNAIPEVSDSLLSVFENLVTGIFDLLPTIVEAGGKLAISLAQGLTEKAPVILKSLNDTVKKLATSIKTIAPQMVKAGKELLESLGNGIEENLPEITATVLDVLMTVLTSILSIKTQLLNTGGQIIKAIGEGIINFMPTLVDHLPEIINLIVEFFATKYEVIATVGADLLSQLVASLPLAIQKIGEKLPELIQGIVSRFGEFAGTIAEAGAQLFSALAQNLPEILTAIWEALKSVDWLGLGKQLLDSLLSAFGTLGESLKGLFDTALPLLGDIDWSSIWNGIVNALGSIGSWIAGLFGIGKDGAANLSWSDIGTSITNGIGTILDSGGSFLSSLFEAGKNAVEIIPWSSIGTAITTAIDRIIGGDNNFLEGEFEKKRKTLEDLDWNAIGTKCSEALASCVEIAANLASGFTEAYAAFTENVDWEAAGELAANAVNGVVIIADALVAGLTEAGTAFAETIDWEAAGKLAGDAVNGVVTISDSLVLGLTDAGTAFAEGIDWTAVGELASNAVNGVVAVANSLTIGLTEACTAFAEGIDWKAVGELAGSAVNGVVEIASSLTDGLKEAGKAFVEGIDWKAAGELASNAVNSVVLITDSLVNGLTNAGNAFAETIDWTNVGTLASNAVNSVVTVADSLVNGLKTAGETMANGIDWTGFGDLGSKAFNTILNAGNSVLDMFGSVVSGITGFVSGGFNALGNIFTPDTSTNSTALTTGEEFANGVVQGIDSKLSTVQDAAKKVASTMNDTLKKELGIDGTTSTVSKKYGEAVVAGVKDGVDAKATVQTMAASGTKVSIAIRDALKTALGTDDSGSKADAMKFAGNGVVLGIEDGIEEKAKKNTFDASAKAVLTAITEAMNAALGISAKGEKSTESAYLGEGLALGVAEGVSKKAIVNTFSGGASKLANEAATALNTAFGIAGTGMLGLGEKSASKFTYIGECVAVGIANGISSNASKISAAARNAATAAYNAATKELGISSPSKKGIEIGKYFDEGIAGGIEKSTDKVRESVKMLSDELYDRMKAAVDTQISKNSSMYDDLTSTVNAQSEQFASAIDTDDLARKIWDNAPEISVNIDGKRAGTLLEPHISREQGDRTKSQSRRNGNV